MTLILNIIIKTITKTKFLYLRVLIESPIKKPSHLPDYNGLHRHHHRKTF